MNNNENQEDLNTQKKELHKHYRNEALKELVNGKPVYIFAFLVPLIIMIAIYAMREIFPFGNVCYLRSDMYHQYCPFFSELWDIIRNGGSLEYTWDTGMGSNFTAIYGYYLSSPINWFIGFFPHESMIEVMNGIILLKLALSSLFCTMFLCKRTGKTHILSAGFGIMYALSGYTCAFSWNIMWLDCIVLLPLVLLGIEKLVKEGKGLLYVLALGFSILSNYYIGIMVCMSCVIYFIVMMISQPINKDVKHYARGVLNFIIYSLLSGLFAAAILLPEIYALGYTASGEMNFPEDLKRYFSFVTVISRHLINTEVSIGLDHLPNIYCGVGVLLLFPMYILCKQIPKREKIIKVLALIVFFAAYNLNIPNFIWHGFHFPNSLPCRQSFIYILMLLSMCYDIVIKVKDSKESHIAGSFWGVMIFFIYLGQCFVDDDFDISILYISAIFIGVYAIFMYIYKSGKINKNILSILVFALMITECTFNVESTGYSTTSRTYYFRDYEQINSFMDKLESEDDSFYRIHKIRGYRTKNDANWHDYKSGNVFSSTAYAHITDIFDKLGLEHSTNAYALNGATPMVHSIFNVKYLVSYYALDTSPLMTLIDSKDDVHLYKNNYTLPLAFMIQDGLNENWDYDENDNPFEVQNSFAYNAAGIEDLFIPLSTTNEGEGTTIYVEEDQFVYAFITSSGVKDVSVLIDNNRSTYSGINHGRIVDIGWVEGGRTVNITDSQNALGYVSLYAYTMDMDKFIQLYEALADEGLNITSYDDTYVKGNINVKEKGTCFTSIPFDEGWTLYVDGVKTQYTATKDAFIAFDLDAGEHQIELKYRTRGFIPGLIITGICGLIFIGLIVFRIIFKKEITEPGALSLLFKKKGKEVEAK